MTNKQTVHRVKKVFKRRAIIVTAIGVGVLLILILGWLVFRNNTLFAPNKEAVRADVRSILDSVSVQKGEVYTDLVDNGCSENGVGLALWWGCSFTGYKYYGTAIPVAQSIQTADSQIIAAGWQRSLFNNQTQEGVEKALRGEGTPQLLMYTNSRDPFGVVLYLGFYKDKANENDGEIQKLVDAGKIKAPSGDEYVYGIRASTSYWSCRQDSFYKSPCPSPPSKPHL